MRFSLRDLFWLVLVAAVGCAWWLDRERLRQAAERDREVLAKLEAVGIKAESLYSTIVNGPQQRFVRVKPATRTQPPAPAGMRFNRNSDYQAPPTLPRQWIERQERAED